MNNRLFLSFLLTVISIFFLYHFDNRSTWNHSYYIISVFVIFWVFSQVNLPNDRYKDDSKIVDLNYYRKQKKKPTKPPEKPLQYSQTITLFSSCEKTKIELIRSLLISHDIECFVDNQHMASIYPSIEGINMEIKVRSEDLDSALQILKQHNMNS